MIRYSLKCAEGHGFESWFRDSAAFDTLAAANSLSCAVCGDSRVEKAIMAPALAGPERAPPDAAAPDVAPRDAAAPATSAAAPPARRELAADAPADAPQSGPRPMLTRPAGQVEKALTQLRRFLSDKADYVGRGFAEEARRIHLGESDKRTIWGEASPEEAEALKEDGIAIAPLPPLARRDD